MDDDRKNGILEGCCMDATARAIQGRKDRRMSDTISRQAAIDEIDEWIKAFRENGHKESAADACLIQDGIIQLPSVEPTLYGYKIEHLAYIARVMEKEGITAEDAARTFSDLGRAVSWTIDEALQKMEEAVRI